MSSNIVTHWNTIKDNTTKYTMKSLCNILLDLLEFSDFNQSLGMSQGFTFTGCDESEYLGNVKLPTMGPKILISNKSTLQEESISMHFQLMGNYPIEIAAVPVDIDVSDSTFIHRKSHYGVASNITVGSCLPIKLHVCHGCHVFIKLTRTSLHINLLYPESSSLTVWNDIERVSINYNGSRDSSIDIDIPDGDYRIGLTCWAHCQFKIMNLSFLRR